MANNPNRFVKWVAPKPPKPVIKRVNSTSLVSDEVLLKAYNAMFGVDAECPKTAYQAYEELKDVPEDDLDYRTNRENSEFQGYVDRRAPFNPFKARILGDLRVEPDTEKRAKKVADPALNKNPLRGKLMSTIGVNTALMFVFFQALIYNYLVTGSFYASHDENGMIGPTAETLYDLGGLDTTAVRAGEWIRLFWAMWMHSGWLHIGFNVLCQLQYMYMLEPDWGFWRTLLTFWVAAMTGNLVSSVLNPCKTTVGSSGGLFGLIGGICTYCVEYWNSIPRPLCLLFFSVIVAIVSLLSGFTGSTDTWAHIGGMVGGTLFGFATVTSLTACYHKEKKTVKKKFGILRWLQLHVAPSCKCGIIEWSVRIPCFLALVTIWTVSSYYLWGDWEYDPLGSITFHGIEPCCCCYNLVTYANVENETSWTCISCDYIYFTNSNMTFGEYCNSQSQQPIDNISINSLDDQVLPDRQQLIPLVANVSWNEQSHTTSSTTTAHE